MEAATMEAPTKTNAQIVAKRFREMAKWLEQHPDIPINDWEKPAIMVLAEYAKADESESEKTVMARAAKAMGRGKKEYTNEYFKLHAEMPEGCSYAIWASRNKTCVATVVGTKEVVIPAQPAKEAVPERTETVDVIEWDCEGILEPDSRGNR